MSMNISLQDYKNRNSFLKAFKDDIRSIPEILDDNLKKGPIASLSYKKQAKEMTE